jgi:hypothetical protein
MSNDGTPNHTKTASVPSGTEDEAATDSTCIICGGEGSVTMDPPRRTLARGADSGDPSFSIIAVLPDVVLCEEHAEEVVDRQRTLGWCDDQQCRVFGEAGEASACGEAYKVLKH